MAQNMRFTYIKIPTLGGLIKKRNGDKEKQKAGGKSRGNVEIPTLGGLIKKRNGDKEKQKAGGKSRGNDNVVYWKTKGKIISLDFPPAFCFSLSPFLFFINPPRVGILI